MSEEQVVVDLAMETVKKIYVIKKIYVTDF